MSALSKLDALAQTLADQSMGIRLTIEVGADAVVADMQIIVSIPGEGPEAGYGIEGGAPTSEAAVEMLVTELDAGGLDQARAFRDERLPKAALKGFKDRRDRKRQMFVPGQANRPGGTA
jgi:hypothetical protein